ncbi:MAG TPA: serine/threonine-protein kinase, partial [Polyangiaceae bacterium]|nr:serine/threonine-protein kinase [Polyangiaceae bacterium]
MSRYTLFDELASGGFARVHLGRLNGDAGFARLVAIKRLHESMAADPEAIALLLDEARLAARIRHPNVVQTIDVLSTDSELWLVMEYVHGETLSRLCGAARRRGVTVPLPVLGAIMSNALSGLHAAHETVDEAGALLNIVHRDVSPQNIIVGADGVARVLDFGIAKANGIEARTREGQFRGKLTYAAPEQIERRPADRAVDIYAAGVVLWEALVGRRLFVDSTEPEIILRVALGHIMPPSEVNPAVSPAAEAVVMRALARDPAARFPTALAMAGAVEQALGVAPSREVGAWVADQAAEALARCAALAARVELAGNAGTSGRYASISRPPAAAPSLTATTETARGSAAGNFADRGYTKSALDTLPPPPASRRRLGLMALLVSGTLLVLAAAAFSR